MTLSRSIADAPAREQVFARLLRLASGPHVLAAADQSVVSATSFLTLIVVAHWTDAAELGRFVVANSVIGVLGAVQHALIASPYVIQRHRDSASARERAVSCLVQSGLLAALAVAVLLLAQAAGAAFDISRQTSVLIWAVAGAAPIVLLREFAREFSFAHFSLGRILALDLVAAVAQTGLLFTIAYSNRISSVSALVVIALSNAAPALVWLYSNRSEFAWPHGRLKSLLGESWELGKWLLVSRSAILVQGYAGYWITTLLIGTAMTGIYAACVSIVAFANPILFGLYNFLTPRTALTLKESGCAGLRKRTLADAVLLGCLMGAFALSLAVAGKWIMGLLYSSSEYGGYEHVAVILAIGMLILAIGIPPANALASLERGRSIAAISVAGAGLQVLTLYLLLPRMGLVGAAISSLIGSAAITLPRWIAFYFMVCRRREASREQDAVQVIVR